MRVAAKRVPDACPQCPRIFRVRCAKKVIRDCWGGAAWGGRVRFANSFFPQEVRFRISEVAQEGHLEPTVTGLVRIKGSLAFDFVAESAGFEGEEALVFEPGEMEGDFTWRRELRQRQALRDERCLPAAVRGPRDLAPFRREA